MKKILIICDLFPPAFGPRMGYLCKYLVKAGWQPVVLTENLPDQTFSNLAGNCHVHAIPYYSWGKSRKATIQRGIASFMDFFFAYKNHKTYLEACRLIRQNQFSLILCSTYRTYPLHAAARAARRYRLPWIADLRDIIEQYAGYEFISRPLPPFLTKLIAPTFARISITRRNKLLRRANYVVTVSPWHEEKLRPQNVNIALIYNGYDPEIFFPQPVESEKFIIVYAGRLLSSAMRNPELLFIALKRLHNDKHINPSICRVHWYIDKASWTIVKEEARRQDVEMFMDYKGMSPASEIPSILNRSSILLLLTNKTSSLGPKGIMTTKLFEYLAIEKPILCVQSDESHVAELIRKTRSGLAAVDSTEVYNFLLKHYTQWQREKNISVDIDRDAVSYFSRERQALMFIELFDKIIG
ncbi:MAG: glycosyltransferase [Tannerellaceae bacterium]|jgi:glycosyltransferase involved in cell wall biosynthesis|nr:glycosyltransferase [Tannerellaceae bacterium]